MNKFILQVGRFGIVGGLAAGIHFSTVVFLVQTNHMLPLLANIFGYLCGFQMSYWGHRKWTFSETMVVHQVAIPRLFLVQALGFLGNEGLFYFFLQLHLPYAIALLITLSLLPFFTFVCSKWWVFR